MQPPSFIEDLEAHFEPSAGGAFMQRFGAAGRESSCSQKKVCFVATDRTFLVRLVYELSLRHDWFAERFRRRADR